jgi:hypothetical protein
VLASIRRNGSYVEGEGGAQEARGWVLVSFARHGRPQVQSFPRKREPTPQAMGNAPPTDWIPAPRLRGDKLRGNDKRNPGTVP